MVARSRSGPRRLGRYELFDPPFATGGMASVHFGRLSAAGGFRRTVAIKVPHAELLRDPAVRAMFLDEARIVARIESPNVVATLDVLEEDGALYQVMEYAHGPPLSVVLAAALEREDAVPIAIAVAIAIDVLEGLHAAHQAVDVAGAPLEIVHRDVSPQNVVIDDGGVAKVIDFGIASAANKLHLTQPGEVRGKVSYMAPEQIEGRKVDRRADVYAAGVLLYESLTGRRPFAGDDFTAIALKQTLETAPEPHTVRADVPEELSAIVMRALEKRPQDRFATALAMADALRDVPPHATPRDVAEWLREMARAFFVERDGLLAALPSVPATVAPTASPPPRRTPVVAGAVIALIALVAGGTALAVHRLSAAPTTAASPTSPSAPLASSAALASSVAEAPLTSPSETATTTRAPVATAATTRAPVHVPIDTERTTTTAPITTTASAASTAKPPCCSGELRLRVSECTNNCPPGT